MNSQTETGIGSSAEARMKNGSRQWSTGKEGKYFCICRMQGNDLMLKSGKMVTKPNH